MTAKKKKVETVPHTVTSEDLENNPELKGAGVQEGEEIGLPVETPKSSKTTFDVYKDGELVRTYSVEVHGENAEALANEFVSHAGGEVR